ncbi:hypothetical protein [Metabacillus malikii]|uniref:Uncharacterized protein n=1 Tax=Metabacillus malikii TaxID=1504265 RepID=A0ABT9ZML8_9BACI|nr:hypothetical protein [Metabacillus malikii]MDQ0233031.1 hypothetical protein [Metabacillus malikii]
MNHLETIKENIIKVHELRSSAASIMRTFHISPYLEQRAAINGNRDLSHEGKERKLSELRSKFEDDVMKAASDMQRVKTDALKTVENAAQQILVAPLEEVDETKQKLFNDKLSEVQASVTFSVNSKSALEALNSLVDTQEPALAKQAAEKVLQLSNDVLAIATSEERQQVKMKLGRLHSELYEKGLPQGAQEAKAAIATAKGLNEATLFSPIVVDALGGYSSTLKEYVNKPQDYTKK